MSEMDTEAVGGLLSSILSNPAILSTLSSLMQTTAPPAEAETRNADEPEGEKEKDADGNTAPSENIPPMDIASMLSSINPEMLTKIPEMMSMLAPLLSSKQSSAKKEPPPTAVHTVAAPQKYHPGERTQLLVALKPYVNRDRGDMIDNIVRISRFADVIRSMGGDLMRH